MQSFLERVAVTRERIEASSNSHNKLGVKYGRAFIDFGLSSPSNTPFSQSTVLVVGNGDGVCAAVKSSDIRGTLGHSRADVHELGAF